MKRKKRILPAVTIAAAATALIVWYVLPTTFLKGTDPCNVHSISVFDGNTGTAFDICNADEIQHIVKNIQTTEMRKTGLSIGYLGYRFRMCFYNADGKELEAFIINNDNTIRKDPFFYRCNGNLCFTYLEALADQYTE